MTVRELIEKLQGLNQDLLVVTSDYFECKKVAVSTGYRDKMDGSFTIPEEYETMHDWAKQNQQKIEYVEIY